MKKAPRSKRKMLIKFYQNGIFTVDDGPPRSAEDPVGQRFLQDIKERRVPAEFEEEARDGLDLSIMPIPEDYDPKNAPRSASLILLKSRLSPNVVLDIMRHNEQRQYEI
jgi:hypothetical protein